MILGSEPKNLLDVLVHQGKINESDAPAWRSLSALELTETLRKHKLVSDEDLARASAECYRLKFVRLADLKISPEAIATIPEKLARELKVIAYELDDKTFGGKVLKLAVADPVALSSDFNQKIDDLEKKKNIKIELAVAGQTDFENALVKYKQPEPVKPEVTTNKYQEVDLSEVTIPHDAITKFPEEIAKKYTMVVFEAPTPTMIKVAMADPEDPKATELLGFVKEKNHIGVEIFKASASDIIESFKYYRAPLPLQPQKLEVKPEIKKADTEDESEIALPTRAQVQQAVRPAEPIPEVTGPKDEKPLVLPQNNLDSFLGTNVDKIEDLEAIARENNVPKTLAAIVALAAFKKASDIHIEPTEQNLRIRFRVDGILKDIIKLPLEIHPAMISRVKILSNLKIDENRIPQDGRFDVITSGHSIDFRVSTLPTVHGEKIALRILDKSARIYSFEELGLVGRNLKILTENIDKPYGTILATGPTGSGKSTTLYSILNRVSTATVNIVTLEDPVEYEIPGINQCQIKPKIGFTFASGLRSILRQDPNVIMVGEIRDSETANLAIHAALTGHLVLSSLHTNDASGALLRLINMGIEPFLITSSVNVVLAQRLVRKLCPKCKAPAHIPDPIFKTIEQELVGFHLQKPYQFFEGRGCDECDQGYKGRIGIFEVMPMTEEIEGLAAARKQSSEIKAAAIRGGMITMKQDGLIKAIKGQTTVNEVLRVISV